jgi:hypothetical protein
MCSLSELKIEIFLINLFQMTRKAFNNTKPTHQSALTGCALDSLAFTGSWVRRIKQQARKKPIIIAP